MSEIPYSINMVALAIAQTAPASPGENIGPLREAIARAIMDERERCAKIAEDYPQRDLGVAGNGQWAANGIAAAIRS